MSDFEARMAGAKAVAVELGLEEPDDGAMLAEKYGMVGQPAAVAPQRELVIIEEEIQFYKRTAGQSIIEIGKRLNEAKAQLRHGEWLPWLRNKVDISERSAQDFMRLAREYSKSAEIADLGASKALALLGLPVSEREDFVAEKHTVDGVEKSVADMTAKELKRAIEERDDARKTVEAMKARAEVAEQSREKMEQDMRQLKELHRRAKAAEEEKTEELRRVEAELEELRKKPVDVAVEKVQDPEALKVAREEGAAEAEKKLEAARKKQAAEMAALEDQAKRLKEDLRKAREEAKAANVNMREAEKEARAAKEEAAKANRMAQVSGSQSMVKFSVLFQQAQDIVNQMAASVQGETPENKAKVRNAMEALADAIRKAAGAA